MVVFTRYRRKVVNTTPVVVVYAESCLLKLFCKISNVLNKMIGEWSLSNFAHSV